MKRFYEKIQKNDLKSKSQYISIPIGLINFILGILQVTNLWGINLYIDASIFFVYSIGLPVFIELLVYKLDHKETLAETKDLIDETKNLSNFFKDLKPVGYFKEISDSNMLDLEGEIDGWNPNWALEIRTGNQDLKEGLERIHLSRLLNKKIHKINYMFLDKYKIIDQHGNDRDMGFSVDDFLNYLNSIAKEEDYRNLVEKKYRIWQIPYDHWKKNGSLHLDIKRYRDFLVIKGIKNRNQAAILFMNYHWNCNATGHKYYLEIHGQTELVEGFANFISDLKIKCESKGIKPKKIVFNKVQNQYELKEV